MNSKNLFIILLYLFPLCSYAQNEISGKITNKKGSVIPGASIYIEDLKIGALSDQDGNYSISRLPAGTYLVAVRSLGYEILSEIVKLKGFTIHDFNLTAAPYEEQEVVVTGNATATDLKNTAQPVTEIPHSYLEQNASTNIIDALSRVPGVSGITDGQSIAKPVIRGLGYNRVVTINDGVRQEGQQWGDEFGIEVDQNSVDRVEILKGPASLVYGSDALAGVINLLPEKTLPEGQLKGDILYNYRGNNGLINTMAHLAGTLNSISFSARIDNIMAHAYQNKYDGYVLNSQFSNYNWDGTIGIHRKWGYSQLHYSYFNLKTGIVDGTRDSTGAFLRQTGADTTGAPIFTKATNQELRSYTPFLINQNIRHYKLVWDNSIALGQGRLTAKLAWQQNRRQESNDPSQPDVSDIYYYLNTVNYDLRYVSPTRNDFNFSAGVNGMSQNSQNKGTLLLIPEYSLFDLGAFAIANKKMGRFDISGGIRYDTRQFKGQDDYTDSNGVQLPSSDPNAIHRFSAYNSNFNGVSGSIGATYQLSTKVYLKANIGRGFRAPNVAESGSDGIHDGTVVYEIGTHDLKPESSLQFDFVPGFKTKDVSVELDLFSNSIDNYIYPKQLYSRSSTGGDSLRSVPGFTNAPVFLYTQGTALLIGIEAMLDIHPSKFKWFDWYTAFSTVDAHLQNVPDSVKYLPFTPPARLRSEITLTLPKLSKTFNNSYLRLGMFYSFQQKNIYNASSIYAGLSGYELKASMSPTAAYTLLNASIGTDIISHGRKAFSVYLNVDNIADVAYVDYMSRFKYYPANLGNGVNRVGVYNMGRNASVKVIIPLDFSKQKSCNENAAKPEMKGDDD